MRTNSPTGTGLMLPSGFARSDKPPTRVPLLDVAVTAGGQRWVDLMVTNTIGLYLYSEAVVRMVEEEGFKGIEFFPVEVSRVEGKQLREQRPWPRYYVGRLTGRIGAVVKLEGEPLPIDEQTGLYQVVRPGFPKSYHLQTSTWQGSDFLHISNIQGSYHLCTARVKEAIDQRGLYNFNFYSEREPGVIEM